jgi:hypothetical protein
LLRSIKIFSPKILEKKIGDFDSQLTALYAKKHAYLTLIFKKNAIFAQNVGKDRQKYGS